jgi:hypothetical protein
MVRYKCKPERAAENRRYVERVYEELKATAPAGFHYATFTMPDGVTFVHIASIEGENPLFATDAFKKFVANIDDRCEEKAVTSDLQEVGSYAFHGSA